MDLSLNLLHGCIKLLDITVNYLCLAFIVISRPADN